MKLYVFFGLSDCKIRSSSGIEFLNVESDVQGGGAVWNEIFHNSFAPRLHALVAPINDTHILITGGTNTGIGLPKA